MKIPFAGLYEKLRARFSAPDPPSQRPVVSKPVMKSGSSLSKTVLPNTTRKVAEPNPLETAAGVMTKAASQSAARSDPLSFTSSAKPRETALRSAAKIQIKSERAISLCLSDILDRLPPGLVKPRESFDLKRHILLNASEVEKGMTSGKPAVALTSVYQQAPEVFLRPPAPTDSAVVYLPLDKVLEQFMSFQVRPDQEQEQSVPHVATPILQVTLEDKDRFGTAIEPLENSPKSSSHVESATPEPVTAAEPEATAVATAKTPPIRSPIPLMAKLTPASPGRSDSGEAVATSVDLPPNGTGAPASERVPASSGPPVPTPPSSAPPPPPIPFKVPPPASDIRPRFIRLPGVEPREAASPTPRTTPSSSPERTIALALLPILEELPSFQLNASPSVVPDDVRIRLPLSLIEPQLAKGRVTVAAKVLQKAMPPEYRSLIKSDTAETPISLSLSEVLKHVPATFLRRREDQEQPSPVEDVETPISIAANEDAKRLAEPIRSTGHDDKQAEQAAVETEPSKVAVEVKTTQVAEAESDEPEQRLDARTVVARANALPGVAACTITFADGLNLAGKLPTELGADGLCAVAASLLQKIDNHLHEPKIGPLLGITLHAGKSITFLRRDNIVLAALHSGDDLPRETRDKLAALTEKLSRTYAESEPSHVHH
jgi:predicted regulator of Ras-like GTPase activity (Roadblock/LC7/MglB family)